jgi:ABC-type transport system involved in multi-copper enzyme maturation permease subunit
MMKLIRSEYLKLVYSRTFWGLLAVTSALAVLTTVTLPYVYHDLKSSVNFGSLTNPDLVDTVYGRAAAGYILALILGVLIMAGEFRHSTAVSTFLATPKRITVLFGKLIVAALGGVFYMLVSTGFGFASSAIALSRYPDSASPHAAIFANTLFAAALSGAVLAILGVAIGTLIRNQMVAVTGSLLWLFIIERLITVFLPDIAKYLPTGLISGVLSVKVQGTTSTGVNISSDYLDAFPATLILIAYAAVFSLAAIATTLRKDID